MRRSATATLYPSAGLLYDGHLAGYRRSSPARLLAVEARSRSSACGKTGENEMVVVVQSVAETPCLAYCLGRCLAPIPSVPRLSSQSCPLSWRCHGFSETVSVSRSLGRETTRQFRERYPCVGLCRRRTTAVGSKGHGGPQRSPSATAMAGGGGPSVRFRSIPTVRIVTDAGHFGCSGPRLCENYHIEKMYKMQFLETESATTLSASSVSEATQSHQDSSSLAEGVRVFPRPGPIPDFAALPRRPAARHEGKRPRRWPGLRWCEQYEKNLMSTRLPPDKPKTPPRVLEWGATGFPGE